MAYSFGKALITALNEAGMDHIKVLMGGRLNEAMDGSDVPIDVTDKLIALGISVDNDIDKLVDTAVSYTHLDVYKRQHCAH